MEHNKVRFCEPENLSASTKFINHALSLQGLLPDDNKRDLVFETSDQCDVLNIVYALLLARERDAAQREQTATRCNILESDNDKLQRDLRRSKSSVESLKDDSNQLNSLIRKQKSELQETQRELKIAKDQTQRTQTALLYLKNQHQSKLREKDLQLAKIKDNWLDGATMRRNRATSNMQLKSSSMRAQPLVSAQVVDPVKMISFDSLQHETHAQLFIRNQQLISEQQRCLLEMQRINQDLSDLIEPWLKSTESLIEPTIDGVELLGSQMRSRVEQAREIVASKKSLHEVELKDALENAASYESKLQISEKRIIELEALVKRLSNAENSFLSTPVRAALGSPLTARSANIL